MAAPTRTLTVLIIRGGTESRLKSFIYIERLDVSRERLAATAFTNTGRETPKIIVLHLACPRIIVNPETPVAKRK